MARRRYAIAYLGLTGRVEAMPVLKRIVSNETEIDYVRGDALAALYSFGGVYAVLVLDWETTQIGIFGILGAVTAAGAVPQQRADLGQSGIIILPPLRRGTALAAP